MIVVAHPRIALWYCMKMDDCITIALLHPHFASSLALPHSHAAAADQLVTCNHASCHLLFYSYATVQVQLCWPKAALTAEAVSAH